jgi:hypothetical protein
MSKLNEDPKVIALIDKAMKAETKRVAGVVKTAMAEAVATAKEAEDKAGAKAIAAASKAVAAAIKGE